uniref:Uncharacterized protein n=1 Tax=Solanum lycopersicum TaxID=4081 RepID=A0A3Q7EXW1_SOLLC
MEESGVINVRAIIDSSGECVDGGHTPWLWKVSRLSCFIRIKKTGQWPEGNI